MKSYPVTARAGITYTAFEVEPGEEASVSIGGKPILLIPAGGIVMEWCGTLADCAENATALVESKGYTYGDGK